MLNGKDEERLVPVRALAAEFRGLVSRKSADQYVRDLIRVTGEAAGDAFFNLQARYATLNGSSFPDGQLCRAWFTGFASLAESTVTSAVETVMQGLGAFSTNPLIAASLGTFAGVAAQSNSSRVVMGVRDR